MAETTSAPETAPEAKSQTPLERLHTFLRYLGFLAEYVPVSESARFECLLVGLDQIPGAAGPVPAEAEADVKTVAQVFFSEDVLLGPETADIKGELGISATLQFLVSLPISFEGLEPDRLLAGLRLLLTCSQIAPIGYLGMDQAQQLYFSYALKASSQDIQIPLIVEILEQIAYFLGHFSPVLADVPGSHSSLEALIGKLERSLVESAQAADTL